MLQGVSGLGERSTVRLTQGKGAQGKERRCKSEVAIVDDWPRSGSDGFSVRGYGRPVDDALKPHIVAAQRFDLQMMNSENGAPLGFHDGFICVETPRSLGNINREAKRAQGFGLAATHNDSGVFPVAWKNPRSQSEGANPYRNPGHRGTRRPHNWDWGGSVGCGLCHATCPDVTTKAPQQMHPVSEKRRMRPHRRLGPRSQNACVSCKERKLKARVLPEL